MEFLDTNLTKDSSILLYAIHSFFLCRKTDKKPFATLDFKIFTKISAIVKRKNEGRKPDKTALDSEKTRTYTQKPRLKIPSKNFISELQGRNFDQASRFVQNDTHTPKLNCFGYRY